MLKQEIISLSEGVWLISDHYLDNFYLVEGTEKAALIDTGAGLGGLSAVVKELTDKPLVILLTHGHLDHIGGVGFFQVPTFIHEADLVFTGSDPSLYGGMLPEGIDMRTWYVRSRGPVRNPKATPEELESLVTPIPFIPEYQTISDGEVIDLGGRTLQVIHTPGHSMGSVCFLDSKSRLLFTGDTCNDSLLLNMPPFTSGVKTYRDNLLKLKERWDDFDAVCLGHDVLGVFDKTIIDDYLEATELIIEGQATNLISADALHSGNGFKHKRVLVWFDGDHILD